LGTAAAAAFILTAGLAVPASAIVNGPCTGEARDTTGKATPSTFDIVHQEKWVVSKESKLSGEGHAEPAQGQGFAYAMAFGFGLWEIGGGVDNNHNSHDGSGSLDITQIADKVRVIGVSGASDSCSGELTIVVGDEGPLDTIEGKAAIFIAFLGLVITAVTGLRARGY
jgi:hypothetical protein